MMTEARGEWAGGPLGLRVFLIMASGYFMAYGLRAINATIAPELVAQTGLTNTELGALTSAYFLAFAAMQVPLGVWLDRFGPRRVDAALIGVAAVGCAAFATAQTVAGLWLGRALMGVGFAAGLMAPLAMYRLWFAPHHQTRMAAWTLTAGTVGVLVATLPVRSLLAQTDWRVILYGCAGLLALIAVTIWFGVPKDREPDAGRAGSFLAALAGYREVARSRYFWRMAMMGGLMQGSFIAMQTLWLGPWFTRVLQLSPEASASALFAFNATLLVAYLAAGYLAPRLGAEERAIVRLLAVAVPITTVLLGLIAALPLATGLWAWMVVAAVSTVFTPIQAHVGMKFPKSLGGRALTGFNLVVFAVTFLLQSGIGLIVDAILRFGYAEVDAFRLGLASLACLQAAAWLYFLFGAWSTPADGGRQP